MLKKLKGKEIDNKVKEVLKEVIEVCTKNQAGHIAPSTSSVHILTALYYNLMNIQDDPQWAERDRLVFSKAHGCYGLYAILADIGYVEKKDWQNFYVDSFLSGCIERSTQHGIEAGCGSLGHGLPQAVGIAFGAKLQGKKYHIYCIMGDGELQEGSNWEAIQFAVKHELSNLTVIVDHNKLQAMDFLHNILTPIDKKDDIHQKFKAFGFLVKECNGHASEEIVEILKSWKNEKHTFKHPQVLIAHTVKGYGLKCMENVPKFHFRLPTEEEIKMGNRYE